MNNIDMNKALITEVKSMTQSAENSVQCMENSMVNARSYYEIALSLFSELRNKMSDVGCTADFLCSDDYVDLVEIAALADKFSDTIKNIVIMTENAKKHSAYIYMADEKIKEMKSYINEMKEEK